MTFGLNIGAEMKEHRKAKKLSVRELADGICTQTTLVNWENGVHMPPLDKAFELAQKLEISLSEYTGVPNYDLTFAEFNHDARRTMVTTDTKGLLMESALGLAGEVGEYADIVKKTYFQNHPIDKVHIASELGDILWYIVEASASIGFTIEEVAKINMMKRLKRYPNGFETTRSIERQEGDI